MISSTLDLHCVIFHIFLPKRLLCRERLLSAPNFTSVILKMNSPPSPASSNYFSHSAWISWSLHGRTHVSFLLRLTTLFRLSWERSYFAGSCRVFARFCICVYVCLSSCLHLNFAMNPGKTWRTPGFHGVPPVIMTISHYTSDK